VTPGAPRSAPQGPQESRLPTGRRRELFCLPGSDRSVPGVLLELFHENSMPVAPGSELPGQFGISAALDLRGIHALEYVVELDVMIPQQILSHYAQARRFHESPRELRV
jgi:hypothetical protein